MFGQRFARFWWFLVNQDKAGGGPDFVMKAVDAVQAGLSRQVYMSVVLPDTQGLKNGLDNKLAVIGLTKFLTTAQLLADPQFTKAGTNTATMLQRMLDLSSTYSQVVTADVIQEVDIDETSFVVTFSSLSTTKKAPRDPAPEVSTAELKSWVSQNLKNSRARVQPFIMQMVDGARDQLLPYLA